jgi:hypothetical protein
MILYETSERVGFEPSPKSLGKQHFFRWRADSGALASIYLSLATLIDAWPRLPEAMRAGMLAMVKAAGC